MGVYTVTQEEWEAVMGNNPSKFKGDKNRPVEMVSWDDCQEFIKKLRAKDKNHYRLPTEAEWEYACRAGTTTPYFFGADAKRLGEFAWFNENANKQAQAVGQKRANPWGLYDMNGNVWQWCADWYGAYPAGEATDPPGPIQGKARVLRGSSWANDRGECRSALRGQCHPPGTRTDVFGMRVVFTP